MRMLTFILLLASLMASSLQARTVQVFVALCDNASQGIVPVPARIGDGNKPSENLYWGCSDGVADCFKRSKQWKLVKREADVSPVVLERLTFRHVSLDLTLMASAYRGSAIRQCVVDFEQCLAEGRTDLSVYVGHNGLMDFQLPQTRPLMAKSGDAMVLCCKSRIYFESRLRALNARPVLLTEQFMYPGAFILRDTVELWAQGSSLASIREAAGKAYAKNQKISAKAGTGIFSRLE